MSLNVDKIIDIICDFREHKLNRCPEELGLTCSKVTYYSNSVVFGKMENFIKRTFGEHLYDLKAEMAAIGTYNRHLKRN